MRQLPSFLCLALVFVLIGPPAYVHAQPRGKALYDLMTTERLTTQTGTLRVDWLPDGSGYLAADRDADGRPVFSQVDAQTGRQSPLFDAATVDALRRAYNDLTGDGGTGLPFSRFDYVFGGDALTFAVDDDLYLYDLGTHALRTLHRPELPPRPDARSVINTTHMASSQLWTGTYSPGYTHIAYVRDYDLYVMDTRTGSERRLTEGGTEAVMNGRPDWLYPEELGQREAFWWSPDGTRLAYLQFDQGDVYRYPLVHSLTTEADLELERYPKAGETNPTVRLFIVDLAAGTQVQVETDSSGDVYILRPTWLRDGSALTFQRLNRHQNRLELLAANTRTGAVRTLLVEEEDAFVNLHDDFYLLGDNRRFLWSSERTGWRQLYLYDLDGTLLSAVTEGDWPVGHLVHVDETNGWAYFTGYTEQGLESQFFRARLDGSALEPLTREAGTHSVNMDPSGHYFADVFSSFTTPPTVTLHRADGTRVRTLMTTDTANLDALKLEPAELVTVKAADGVTELHGLLFKPAGYDPNRSYPLLVSVYGGPHSKSVTNRYSEDGFEQRYAQLGFMVWKMDNRGLTRRGKAFETATYLKLGQIDLADQAAGVRQITQRPYIDGGRVGVFGGSYGGYMTAMALLKEPEVFHVGVAGAPVTDWRNYDTAYTERYMRTPQENPDGYDLGSTLPYAENLAGKLLLVHGTIDNNVHPGNTMQLIDALVTAGKRFDLMMYPEHRHGIRGASGRHNSELRLDYFLEHLDPPAYPWTR